MRILQALPPPATATTADPAAVAAILADVRARGDAAVRDWTLRLDHVHLAGLSIPAADLAAAWDGLPADQRDALAHAARNIRAFAEAQRKSLSAFEIEVEPGVFAGQRLVATDRVACYVPGGRYPLPSTVLMTVLPAVVAGVREIVVFSPPGHDGRPHRAILAAAHLAGATAVHPIGGAQAIAAAAFGTATIAAVDLVVGPGNAWVTEAKRQVYGAVGIDALAGPSEVLVLCDGSSDVRKVAADLLAQAEHDPDAQALAVTDDPAFAQALSAEVDRQLATLPTRAVAAVSLDRHGAIVVVADRLAMVALANDRAPEHLEVCAARPDELAALCTAYGGLFIGSDAAEVLGDYCVGPSHVLPTGRAARYTGGLSALTFLRVLTTQRTVSVKGTVAPVAALARAAACLARCEGLEAHARAADLRAEG